MDQSLLLHTYRLMYSAKVMADIYEANRQITKYVHSTSRGHEAIQLATAFHLKPQDWVSPYYRDESMLLGMGWTPYELMLQLLTKADDPFTGGRSYYSHPNSLTEDKPKIIHQSSATGMQAIPTTGVAQGLAHLNPPGGRTLQPHKTTRPSLTPPPAGGENSTQSSLPQDADLKTDSMTSDAGAVGSPPPGEPEGAVESEGAAPIVLCSLGDASITEGEVAEAFQFAVLKQLPIIYLVQDNDWGISVSAAEGRANDAYKYARGFKGLNRVRVDGTDFFKSYKTMRKVIADVREHRRPWLVHAKVSLLNHHTSGVRKEFYRTAEDLEKHAANDPLPKFRNIIANDFGEVFIRELEDEVKGDIEHQFKLAVAAHTANILYGLPSAHE